MNPRMVDHRAGRPQLPPEVHALLADTAHAATDAINHCWSTYTREQLVEEVAVGADGTPTFRMDEIIESAIKQAADSHGVNLLSEELGFYDVGSARTLVIDPLDGSANAAAGVPLSCFSAVLVEDTTPVEALNVWLETGQTVWARAGVAVPYRTSGRTDLTTAALGLLRPKVGDFGDTTDAWVALMRASSRVRILSTSCLEAMLVARGSIDAFADPGSDTHRLVDLYAAALFIPPAGGVVIDAFGRPIELDRDMTRRWSGIVAASPELGEQIAAVINANVLVPQGALR